jgi:hypothetical protein
MTVARLPAIILHLALTYMDVIANLCEQRDAVPARASHQ